MLSTKKENAKHAKTSNWKTAFSVPLLTNAYNANQLLTTSKTTNTAIYAMISIPIALPATTPLHVRAAFRTSTSSIRMDAVEPAIPHLLDV
jgi:hypothetical protein